MCAEAGRLTQVHECKFSPQPCVQWHYVGTLKSAMGGVFITLNLEKITSPRIFFLPQESQGTHTTLDILFQSGSQENKEYS